MTDFLLGSALGSIVTLLVQALNKPGRERQISTSEFLKRCKQLGIGVKNHG